MNTMFYKSRYEWYMNKPLGINLKNMSEMYVSATEVENSGSECEKKHILNRD